MALDLIKKVELDGVGFQFTHLPGTTVMAVSWVIGKPATAIMNGPIQIGLQVWDRLKKKGIFDKVDDEGNEIPFHLLDLISTDVGDLGPLIAAAVSSFQELFDTMGPDEFVQLLLKLFKGVTVNKTGLANFTITDQETFDTAFMGVAPDAVFLLALEVMRFNRFPFLRGVTIDFGTLLTKMSSLLEDLKKEDNEPGDLENLES